MAIRSIDKYTVVKRFSLGKRMYDKMDTIYIQEQDMVHGEPQMVFNDDKAYVTDILPDIYIALKEGFIELSPDHP